jgi:hypothetical protein
MNSFEDKPQAEVAVEKLNRTAAKNEKRAVRAESPLAAGAKPQFVY